MNTKDYSEPAKSQIAETMEEARNRVGETARNVSYATDRYVRENPWKTVAIVALAACVIGYLLSYARD